MRAIFCHLETADCKLCGCTRNSGVSPPLVTSGSFTSTPSASSPPSSHVELVIYIMPSPIKALDRKIEDCTGKLRCLTQSQDTQRLTKANSNCNLLVNILSSASRFLSRLVLVPFLSRSRLVLSCNHLFFDSFLTSSQSRSQPDCITVPTS